MKVRVLPMINAIGCALLAALVVAQWLKERSLHQLVVESHDQLVVTQHAATQERERKQALERDIAVLKEAVEASQKAGESTARALSEQSVQVAALQADLTAARNQVMAWEAAVKARDQRISDLTSTLEATRKRLDQAIARLKTPSTKEPAAKANQ